MLLSHYQKILTFCCEICYHIRNRTALLVGATYGSDFRTTCAKIQTE